MQADSAAYHGYWGLDFTNVDPHLGTNADFAAFVDCAHSLGLKVYLDVVVNHTADVILLVGRVELPRRRTRCRTATARASRSRRSATPAASGSRASRPRYQPRQPIVLPAEPEPRSGRPG